tara:strand:+ start:1298 stop:1726 length:429 start_codon:yes stop_codon:yes gene_type:complete
MQLRLKRDQKAGMTGNVTFKLYFIVDLDPEEAAALQKYKFGKDIVYETPTGAAASAGLRGAEGVGNIGRGLVATLAAKALNQILTVNDMVNGKEIACKDIGEMIAAEEQIKEACNGLSRILYACRHFEGEEIIDVVPFQSEA